MPDGRVARSECSTFRWASSRASAGTSVAAASAGTSASASAGTSVAADADGVLQKVQLQKQKR